ncbi:MAG: cobalamin-binding protein [Vulcanimicrobiaceae bacterium]
MAPEHGRRIASLLPSATEIVYALGLGDRLVGVTHECDHPEAARTKPQLTASALERGATASAIDRHVRAALHAGSSLYALDRTLLDRLAPDLILTQELCDVCAVSYAIVARAARTLASDPRVVSLEPSSLEDVYATIATVGALTGTAATAREVVARLRDRASALAAYVAPHVAGRARPRALVLEWTDPPMSGGHWTPELVELAGGEPLLAGPGADSRALAWASIAAADPDVILVAPCGFALDATLAAIAELAAAEPTWNALRAVASHRAFAIDGDAYVNRPGPRLVDSAELFASALWERPYGAALADPYALRKL